MLLEEPIEQLSPRNQDEGVSYMSKLPRSVFACVSEERALKNIIMMLSGIFFDDDIDMAIEDIVFRTNCKIDLKLEGNFIRHVRRAFAYSNSWHNSLLLNRLLLLKF